MLCILHSMYVYMESCFFSYSVLSHVLKSHTLEQLMKFGGLHSILEGLIPYTERHFQRLSRLLQVYLCIECHYIFTGNNTLFAQLSMFVDYTWQCMKLPDQFSATGSEMMQTAKDTLSGSVMSGHSDVTIAVADSTTNGMSTAVFVYASSTLLHKKRG